MKRNAIFIASLLLGASTAVAQSVVLTPEAQTEFRTYVTTEQVAPVEIEGDVAVGIALPDAIELQPVPDIIVSKVPDYEGYRYAVAGGRIIIVEPSSTKVVAVIDE